MKAFGYIRVSTRDQDEVAQELHYRVLGGFKEPSGRRKREL
ncbi:MAG: hypothetical protein QW096_12415 [Thermofilaceae archaeon]